MAPTGDAPPPATPIRPGSYFDVRSTTSPSGLVIELSGEIDLYSARWVAEELRRYEDSDVQVIVDLEHVDFMDRSGLTVLLDAVDGAFAGRLWVTPGPLQVQRLFELSGMGERFDFVPPVAGSATAAAA